MHLANQIGCKPAWIVRYGLVHLKIINSRHTSNASGANEIYCDRLGRVRVRYHWQGQHEVDNDEHNATCWVRVAQRSAEAGMGVQFLPRIGQEVLVQFIEGDIDSPIIYEALFGEKNQVKK